MRQCYWQQKLQRIVRRFSLIGSVVPGTIRSFVVRIYAVRLHSTTYAAKEPQGKELGVLPCTVDKRF
jgi:hypothetical protein